MRPRHADATERKGRMKHPRVLLLVAPVLLAAGTVSAETDPGRKSEWLGGVGLLVGFPLGDFADATDTGFGMSGHGVFTPNGEPFGIRLQLEGLIYGSRSTEVVVPGSGGLVTTDLTTDNWLFNVGVGPQIQARSGPVRPYAYALAGVGYFSTDTSLGDDSGYGGYTSTNYDDTTFAWSAGGGLLIPVSNTVLIDVGVHYVGNGTVSYLAEGDLRPSMGDRPPVIIPRQSEANVLALTIGVSFGH
jgi:opacity protein-like surface antigen